MNSKNGLAYKIWDIVYPVGMYYAAITIGIFIAQLLFGASNESYMLCKIIGSLVALPVVYADYKHDLIMTGRFGRKFSFSKCVLYHGMIAIGITICLSIALNNIISMSPLVRISVEYENASNAFYGSTLWLELIGSAFVTPILEELLHRGVVFGRLRKWMNPLPAVLISSFIFAMLHFNVVQFIYAFLLGMLFAVFVEKTGHLYPAVLAHIVANGIAVVRTETGFLLRTVDGSVFAWLISITLFVVGLVGMMFYIKNKNTNEVKNNG